MDPQNPHKKLRMLRLALTIPVPGRREGGSLGLHGGQPASLVSQIFNNVKIGLVEPESE